MISRQIHGGFLSPEHSTRVSLDMPPPVMPPSEKKTPGWAWGVLGASIVIFSGQGSSVCYFAPLVILFIAFGNAPFEKTMECGISSFHPFWIAFLLLWGIFKMSLVGISPSWTVLGLCSYNITDFLFLFWNSPTPAVLRTFSPLVSPFSLMFWRNSYCILALLVPGYLQLQRASPLEKKLVISGLVPHDMLDCVLVFSCL